MRNLGCAWLFLVVILSSEAQFAVEPARTTKANVEMTINNLGIIGNSFRGTYSKSEDSNPDPWGSCEYPKKSSLERLFNGGLWIGGIVEGGQIAVSTGAISSASGYQTGAAGYEFTAASKLIRRSNLLDNPNYSAFSVSQEDIMADFTDRNTFVPGTSQLITGHVNPLFVDVHMEAYNWNFSSADFFIPLTFTIKNSGTKLIDSVYIGYWSDFVVRNVSITPPGGTPFFASGGNVFVDSLCMAYEFDADDINPNSKGYAGLKFLGAEDKSGNFLHPRTNQGFKCRYNTWSFSGNQTTFLRPQDDNQSFNRLRRGQNVDPTPFPDFSALLTQIKGKGNRSNLVSVGPFGRLAPGEQVKVSFAIVCAATVDDGQPAYLDTKDQRGDFIANAISCQNSFNGEDKNFNGKLDEGEEIAAKKNGKLDRWIFPEPPVIPKTKVVAKENEIDVYWTDNAVVTPDPSTRELDFEGFRIYKTQVGFDVQTEQDLNKDLKLVASYDVKANGKFFDNGFDSVRLAQPVVFEGDTNRYQYKYSFKNVLSGWQHAVSITAFDKGNDTLKILSQESSKLDNIKRVFPGKPANNSLKTSAPFVYPNPYYGVSAWDGFKTSYEEDKRLVFSNLPVKCNIKIYTYSGDLVDEINHDMSYNGGDLGNGNNQRGWYNNYAPGTERVFSGGEHAWDLLSKNSQLIARGLYIFSVEDLATGQTHPGKFVVIK